MTDTFSLPIQNTTQSVFQPIDFTDVTMVSDIPEDVVMDHDEIAFMQPFVAKPLNLVKKDLQQANLQQENIEEILAGLATLPEYSD